MAAADSGVIEQMRAQARVHHDAGRLQDAENGYRRIVQIVPGDVQARHMIGLLHLQQDRPGDALRTLDPLLTEATRNPDIRAHRGLALQLLGRSD